MPMSPSEKARLIDRIGWYLAGVAIGCVVVGLMLQLKQVVYKRWQAQRQQQAGPGPAAAAESPGSAGTSGK